MKYIFKLSLLSLLIINSSVFSNTQQPRIMAKAIVEYGVRSPNLRPLFMGVSSITHADLKQIIAKTTLEEVGIIFEAMINRLIDEDNTELIDSHVRLFKYFSTLLENRCPYIQTFVQRLQSIKASRSRGDIIKVLDEATSELYNNFSNSNPQGRRVANQIKGNIESLIAKKGGKLKIYKVMGIRAGR